MSDTDSLIPISSITGAQASIDSEISKSSQWTATLPFSGVVGYSEPVDLFEYTKPEYRVKRGKNNHNIKFDSTVYAPTDEGLLLLRAHLSFNALQEGTAFNSRSEKSILTCFRSRVYAPAPKKRKDKISPISHSSNTSLLEEEEDTIADEMPKCDNWGVKVGIREHTFHCDNSYKRPGGGLLM